MPIALHWFLPTAGDSRDVVGFGPTAHQRPADLEYLALVARSAESLGFEAVLTPTGTWCHDAWLTTAALIRETSRLKFLVAFRPGLVTPTLAAQQAQTFQRLSGGRLLVNIVTGGDAVEQRRFGDHLDHDERYDRTAEFLSVLRGAWGEEPFDYTGRYYQVEGATVAGTVDPVPRVFFGGSSDAAHQVAVRHADVHLTWGDTPEAMRVTLDRLSEEAHAVGRDLRFGIRLHVISRDRAADAWAEADRLLDSMPDDVVARAQRLFSGTQSVGQRAMLALHGGRKDDLVVAPNLWAGYGLVRSGAGLALVGSHDEVAERVCELADLGFEELILSGQPHLEEAWRFGEGVLPLLRRAGVLRGADVDAVGAPVASPWP